MSRSSSSLGDGAPNDDDDGFTFAPSLNHTVSNSSRPVSSDLHSSTSSLVGTPSPSGVRRTIFMNGPLSSLRDMSLKAAKLPSSPESLLEGVGVRQGSKTWDGVSDDEADITAGEDDLFEAQRDYFGDDAQALEQIQKRKAALAQLNSADFKSRTPAHQRQTIVAARALVDALDAIRHHETTSISPGSALNHIVSSDASAINEIALAVSPDSKAQRAKKRAEEMESSLPNMSAIIAGVKEATLYLPSVEASALDVRTWFIAVLELKYDMDPEEAMSAVKGWKILGGKGLREVDEQVFRGIFGAEIGWVLFREVQDGARKSGEVLNHSVSISAAAAPARKQWSATGLCNPMRIIKSHLLTITALDLLIFSLLAISVGCAIASFTAVGRYDAYNAADRAARLNFYIAAAISGWLWLILYAGYYHL